MRNIVFGAALAAALTACGGDGGGGTTNTGATPASVTVSATGSDALASFGDSRTLTAVVKDAGGNVISNPAVLWSASPAGVVTLGSTTGLSTDATAAGNGTATITATSGGVSGTASVGVQQKFAGVKLPSSTVSVSPGSTLQLNPVAADARQNAIAGVTGFTFSSSDQSVATVSAAGLVTGIKDGTVTITVSLTRDGVSANAPVAVTVSAASATASVEATGADAFSPPSVDVAVGGTVTWTFDAQHNVTFTSAGSPSNIPTTNSGTVSRTFPTAGTFNYTCTIHPGMNGTVTVR